MKTTASAHYERLNAKRHGVLARARAAAELTIPSLMPPEGSNESTELLTPYQSLGARGLNNLSSKLLLTLFPAGISFFRFQIDEFVLKEMGGNKEAAEEAMRKLENQGTRRIEAGNLRGVAHSALRHLIAAGNACIYMPSADKMRMFPLNQYVVERDAQGVAIRGVIEESVGPTTLAPEVIAACSVKAGGDEDVSVYTIVELQPGGEKVEWHQEINDITVPGSEGRCNADETPFFFLRWSSVEGEDYGRGLVEEYLGDLRSLEGLSKAVIGFAAVASKVVVLAHPNSTTNKTELAKAETGDVITGDIRDLDVFQLDKYADFQIAKAMIDDLTLRVSHAFLLQSGTVRDAERVTRAEIIAMAQELEDVLGGTYTILSRELQLPIVRRLMSEMKKAKEFPEMPKASGKEVVSPVVITGFDALGRGHELNKFRTYFADLAGILGPEAAVGQFSPERIAKKFAVSHNIDIEDIAKTAEERQADQQAAQAAQLMDKAAGPVAGALAQGAMEGQ